MSLRRIFPTFFLHTAMIFERKLETIYAELWMDRHTGGWTDGRTNQLPDGHLAIKYNYATDGQLVSWGRTLNEMYKLD